MLVARSSVNTSGHRWFLNRNLTIPVSLWLTGMLKNADDEVTGLIGLGNDELGYFLLREDIKSCKKIIFPFRSELILIAPPNCSLVLEASS